MENQSNDQQQNETPVLGVEWVIAGGSASVTVQIVLSATGITLSTVPGIGPMATLTLTPQAANTLGRILSEKSEAAARKAGIVLQHKLSHEST